MATGGMTDTDILSDEIFDVLCSMCKHKGKNTEGVKFCAECDDYFCVKCVNIHSQVPLCVSHKLLDKALVKSGTSKGLQRVPAERCDIHSHKHIDMYCQNHDKVGCSTCMFVDHRLCRNTFYIPDYLKNNLHNTTPKEIQTKLKAITKTLTEQTDKYKEDKQRLVKRKQEILAKIRKLRQEINNHLDKLEKNSVADIENKVKNLERKIEKGLKQLQDNKDRVTSALHKLTSPNINQTEGFVYVKMGENVAKVAETSIEENKIKVRVDGINFDPNQKLITRLEESSSLGIIPCLLQIKGEKSYNVKIKSDKKNCHITSACYMEEDGTIILADLNNMKVKRLDCNNYTVRDYCDLTHYPWQVCSVNRSQVAVSLPFKGVHLISLDRQMKTINKLNTDFNCYGLAYANNNLYISDRNTSVYTYTLSGRKLRQFSMDQSGCTMFSFIQSLDVSKDASRIYVAYGDKGFIVLDNNGQVVSTIKSGMLKGACYCHFTKVGTILVVGLSSNNVVQFTSNGDLIGEVLSAEERMGRVWSVCCNQQMSKMFVSRYNAGIIKVYDIVMV